VRLRLTPCHGRQHVVDIAFVGVQGAGEVGRGRDRRCEVGATFGDCRLTSREADRHDLGVTLVGFPLSTRTTAF
jgi:hypothetical protein